MTNTRQPEVLGVDIAELGPVSLEATRPVTITNQCSQHNNKKLRL